MNIIPQRGEIWWVSLDPTKGSEIKKTRPCLVISRDSYNRAASTVTIIPLASGASRYSAWEVEVGPVTGVADLSHLVLPQIRVASKERFKKNVGKILPSYMAEIQKKLLFYLGFDDLFQGSIGLTTITGGSVMSGTL